jgi:bile acid:Na+ symporter, BASS family
VNFDGAPMPPSRRLASAGSGSPGNGSPVVTIALVVLLVATMLTLGTGLTGAAFAHLLRHPAALVLALAVNVLLIPAIAVVLVSQIRQTVMHSTGAISTANGPLRSRPAAQ